MLIAALHDPACKLEEFGFLITEMIDAVIADMDFGIIEADVADGRFALHRYKRAVVFLNPKMAVI
jgi:hypothetical protein